MVYGCGSATQSPSRRIAERNPSIDLQARPTITYGKPNRPLLLRGTHFMRPDPYDVPLATPKYETPAPQRRRPAVKMPEPDDSPLSEGELEAVYGNTGTGGNNVSPASASPSSRTSLGHRIEPVPPRTSSPSGKRGFRNASNRLVCNPRHHFDLNQDVQSKTATEENFPRRLQAGTAAVTTVTAEPVGLPKPALSRVNARRRIVQPDSPEPKVPPRKIATPIRRLPVDELLLVPFPPEQQDHFRDPDSSFAGIQKQDPIADSLSPAQKPVAAQTNGKSLSKEKPLTSIRKRLKTSTFSHKSIFALRKKADDQKLKLGKVDRVLGDGFDASELKIRPCQVKKQRRNGTTPLRGLGTLQLQHGPLPEVKFEEGGDEFKVEPPDGQSFPDEGIKAVQTFAQLDDSKESKSDRRVTFSDSFFDETTRAELSSVSAPRRVFEISSDESEQEEDEQEDEDDEDDSDSGAGKTEMLSGEEHHERPDKETARLRSGAAAARSATPTSFQRARPLFSAGERLRPAVTPFSLEDSRHAGVTLDFRKSVTPGYAGHSLRTQRLMEVNEMIIDSPPVDETGMSLPEHDAREHNYTYDDRRMERVAAASPTRRPRSILRSSTPIPHNRPGTRPQDTVANTRRNSNIALESQHFVGPSAALRGKRADHGLNLRQHSRPDLHEESGEDRADAEEVLDYEIVTRRRKTAVTLEDTNSRYFESASSQLHHPPQESRSPPRRMSKHQDAAASHFFAQRRREAETHVLGSSRTVPDTSPQRKTDYMTNLGLSLNIVRREAEKTWTSSQSLPDANNTKDLKSLTRSVSREHGTLSQARRRPTLPFQSPTKAKT